MFIISRCYKIKRLEMTIKIEFVEVHAFNEVSKCFRLKARELRVHQASKKRKQMLQSIASEMHKEIFAQRSKLYTRAKRLESYHLRVSTSRKPSNPRRDSRVRIVISAGDGCHQLFCHLDHFLLTSCEQSKEKVLW